jgi:hypothetical protein
MGTRPLIDKLQEATFGDATPMQWVENKYALRMILRKARCFNIDTPTSALIADFSIAIATDLEAARHLAIPPFPVTWFEIDNIARLERMRALGVSLSKVAAGDDVVPNVGWLITRVAEGDYCASYVSEFYDGVFVAPISFNWSTTSAHCHSAPAKVDLQPINDLIRADLNATNDKICFGVRGTNVSTEHVMWAPASFQRNRFGNQEADLMRELQGELRHIWGLLIALGTSTVETTEGVKHEGPVVMAKGKPLLPLEHKTLKVHLGKKRTVIKVVERALHGVRKRWHEVRAHTRLLKSGARIPVKSHARGDEKLGKITKTYVVEK